MGDTLNIGIVGAGVISGAYLAALPALPGVEIVAVADLDLERAAAVAAEHGIRAMSVDELLADEGVDLVLNLTIPAAHAEVALAAIAAGKHVYGEKPLALDVAEARQVLDAARERGVVVGSAPDTVLGTGIQTARALLDAGAVGEPVAASVNWLSAGHESWHPNPDFYYQPGGGPLLDMGPYYLSALVTLFGPVARVSGATVRSDRDRVIGSGPRAGSPVPVDVETHITATVEHANGVVASVTVSFEVRASRAPLFEVYGTEGSLAVPDPNQFSRPVEIWHRDRPEWVEAPASAGYVDAGRGIGVADLAGSLATGTRPARASGELGLHVLEVMEAILVAGREHRVVDIASTVERPEVVDLGADPRS
ncbi:MAG: Gfo/Idh/MocA family oxidoreductase [Microbacteriaceae bacterium]